jgi:hypothetical protein
MLYGFGQRFSSVRSIRQCGFDFVQVASFLAMTSVFFF